MVSQNAIPSKNEENMNKELNILKQEDIKSKIYTIRGLEVMLDTDLADLYKVETRVLNQAVRRNINRFPNDFMFQLNNEEFENWKSQIVISNSIKMGLRKKPLVFTEQGVAALSGVLKSSKAIEVNIQIMRAFVSMRKFIASNAQLFQRIDRTEQKLLEHDEKFEKVFEAIESKDIKPKMGIFFDGQIFDAYSFISNLVRSAKEEIILLDNYVDDTVLTLFIKRKVNVNVTILTKEITKQLKLDLEKYNSQYPKLNITEFKSSHDRFLIIDDQTYHFGASLKDLGKRWFAFSKFDKELSMLLSNKLNPE